MVPRSGDIFYINREFEIICVLLGLKTALHNSENRGMLKCLTPNTPELNLINISQAWLTLKDLTQTFRRVGFRERIKCGPYRKSKIM